MRVHIALRELHPIESDCLVEVKTVLTERD